MVISELFKTEEIFPIGLKIAELWSLKENERFSTLSTETVTCCTLLLACYAFRYLCYGVEMDNNYVYSPCQSF